MELKQKIILESLRLFSLKGFLSTSVQDILEAAGTSKGGFYNHFKSKEELFFAVLAEARKIWRDKHLVGLEQIDRPVEKVKKLLQNHRDFYLKDTECLPGGCIFVTLLVELDDQLPVLAQEVNKGFYNLKAMINRFMEQGKLSGELREDTDTNAVTEMIFSGILGATVSYGMEKSLANVDRTINAMLDYMNLLAP
ncbi:MAG: TetR/AcrR family transcriptional regulator [Deltaproteobacteria bacterium]|nr:TetR/AcrR family transcriptional regulator [Deltaproteobacteria bacterium]